MADYNNNNDSDTGMDNTLATTTGLSYGSGLAGLIAGLSLHDWLAIGGFAFMALTFFANLYFRHRDELRKSEQHAWERMKQQTSYTSNVIQQGENHEAL